MTSKEREALALEEILRKATAPEYAHQSLNLMAGRMEEIGEVARAALAAREEPQRSWTQMEQEVRNDQARRMESTGRCPCCGADV